MDIIRYMSKIKIITDKIQMEAELNESKTANFIYKSLADF